jgi:hypothetical protein
VYKFSIWVKKSFLNNSVFFLAMKEEVFPRNWGLLISTINFFYTAK